ncbi:hypothetical protein NC651_020448 [Populus alba x Populus x berolinensis]|nr:hypothetical protein NC651_020448 [Populus alba x Populus x berolinensis]
MKMNSARMGSSKRRISSKGLGAVLREQRARLYIIRRCVVIKFCYGLALWGFDNQCIHRIGHKCAWRSIFERCLAATARIADLRSRMNLRANLARYRSTKK